jgi:hypothetical protein
MGNMSYCRFENTARDLRDCLEAIENESLDDLSSSEKRGLRQLLEDCETITFMKEDIEDEIESNYNN